MNKQSYLEKYNEEHSSVAASLTINKKILTRLVGFVICSILYFIIYQISKNRGSSDIQTQFINSFVSSIMLYSSIIAGAVVIWAILCYFIPAVRNAFDNVKFKIKKTFFFIIDWVVILPICATVASFCFAFLFTFAQVDGTSMSPTINDESTVFVTYMEKVERFDVVVAYVSAEDNIINKTTSSTYSEYYIKRIIGLPGDTVTWKDGVLKINGEIIKEDYIKLSIVGSGTSFDGIFSYKKDGELQPTTTVIPDGYYFVMGDNRGNSIDSRDIGLIPFKNIEGIAKYEFTGSGIERID